MYNFHSLERQVLMTLPKVVSNCTKAALRTRKDIQKRSRQGKNMQTTIGYQQKNCTWYSYRSQQHF